MKKLILFITLLSYNLFWAQDCLQVEASDSFGNSDIVVDCDYAIDENVCLDLEVDYPTFPSTEDYEVLPISFEPIIPFNQGTPLTPQLPQENGLVDDKFSDAIPLGFTFCFYDQNFTDIVIGTNGLVTFDLTEANSDIPSAITATNPDPILIDNAIFGPQQDLVFSLDDDSEIYYSTIGTAPCRKFVINFYNAINFGCPERSTSQIVLHELTNEIEIHILEKYIHCPNGRDGNALAGIMNSDGTLGISPPDRNTGDWSAFDESWLFSPIGDRPPLVVWKDNAGEIVGQGDQITVCPNRDTTYTVEVQYQSCVGNDLFETDTIQVQYAAEFPVIENSIIAICDVGNNGNEEIIFADYNDWFSLNDINRFTFTYYLSQQDAENQTNPQTSQILSGNTTYYLRIENNSNPNCFTITPVQFSFTASAISITDITLCDNNNDGVESNINLVPYMLNMLNGIEYETYSIHTSENDALNQSNAITSADLTEDSEFWIYLETSAECSQAIGPVEVNFLSAPNTRSTSVITFEACDINFDHVEPFEWQTEVRNVMNINSNETFTVHTSYLNAVSGSGSQEIISDSTNPYYVRIENVNGCFTIIEQPVDVTYDGVDAVAVEPIFCFDGTEDITVNLEDYLAEMLIDPLQGVDISLYDNAAAAEGHLTDEIIAPVQTISEDGYLVEQTYYVRFQLSEDCYTVRTINILLVHPVPLMNPIDVCDINNDGIENNALYIYDSLILGDQPGTVNYYLTETDAINNLNEITTYEFVDSQVLYVRITVHDCMEIYPITFQLQSVPPVDNLVIDLGEVCDTNASGVTTLDLTAISDGVYMQDDDVIFNYYESYNPLTEELTNPIITPDSYEVTDDFVFYIEVVSENMICSAVAEINVHISFASNFEINPAELYICDFEFDFNEEFYLLDAIPQMVSDLENFDESLFEITFHTSQEDADAGENPIQGDFYIPNSAEFAIYVRLNNLVTGCVATNILTLYTLGAPKPVNGFHSVCDNNLNGMYDLDLNELALEVMDETEGFNFSYYLSEDDALNEVNALDPTVIYETDPFPTTIWVHVEREVLEGCFDMKPVQISFNDMTIIGPDELEAKGCDLDNDGFATFDLTIVEDIYPSDTYSITYYESLEQVNEREPAIENPSEYINSSSFQQNAIVVIQEGDNCPNYASINLTYTTIQVQVEDILFCPEDIAGIFPEVLVSNPNYAYEWLDSEGNLVSTDINLAGIDEEETFTFIVTHLDNPSCQLVQEVEASTYESPIVLDLEVEGDKITVLASGAYPIEYSLNGVDWQISNQFSDLPAGVYSIWVRYITEGCISDPKSTVILNIPNVITPNGDGYNDYILIDDLEVFDGQESEFSIYDRYGKRIFHETSNTQFIWDGTFGGRVLNSTDYWYILKLPDGQEFSGSITVKNY